MAFQLLNVGKTFQHLINSTRNSVRGTIINASVCELPKIPIININSTRSSTNFFNTLPAHALWKGITSVSNAGKKRGRGKTVSKKNIKDLNRGQLIGVGKANMVWPGLTAPIIRGKELVAQQKLPEDPEREKKLIELRDSMGSFKYAKMFALDRGWSGAKMPGRSVGPPDPVEDETFDGFDTKVIELKSVFNMKGNFGRKRRMSVFVVTGNRNGLGGFATGKGLETRIAMRKAKNRSGQKLMHIDIFRNRTVYHDFYTQFGRTKIFVSQKPEGFGLVCHRAIKTICEVVGIKDLYAKVEGSTNVQHVVKAFFLGLIKQKTHQQIAEDKKLHLVEFCKENHYYPTVLASPSEVRTADKVTKDEILDYKQYCLGGNIVLKKKKPPPFFTKLESYQKHLNRVENFRNQDKVKRHLIFEYGEIRSFLTDKHPEARPFKRSPKEEPVAEE